MKKEKLIKSIKNIDDDLICEAMNRRSEETPPIEEKAEIISVSGGKKRSGQLWKYPVTAAALLGVIGGAVFVANNRGVIDNIDTTVSGEPSESIADTVNPEISENVSKTVEETISTIVSKEPDPIVPKKITGQSFYRGLFIDSYPEIQKPDINKEYFKEMNTKELLEYYGIQTNIIKLIENKEMIEVSDEDTMHGIYTFPDGSIYDVNTFTFEMTYDSMYHAKRFTFTIGKESTFGQAYYKCYDEALKNPQIKGSYIAFYNDDNDIFYSIRNVNGITYMFSGTVDEISGVDCMTDLHMKESYKKYDKDFRNSCEDLPAAIEKFCQTKNLCLVI